MLVRQCTIMPKGVQKISIVCDNMVYQNRSKGIMKNIKEVCSQESKVYSYGYVVPEQEFACQELSQARVAAGLLAVTGPACLIPLIRMQVKNRDTALQEQSTVDKTENKF